MFGGAIFCKMKLNKTKYKVVLNLPFIKIIVLYAFQKNIKRSRR